jgi:hypothetical protein
MQDSTFGVWWLFSLMLFVVLMGLPRWLIVYTVGRL